MSDENEAAEASATSSKKPIIAGAVGLGIAGMLLLGIVVINDDGRPEDQPEPDPNLAAQVLDGGMSDDDPLDDEPIFDEADPVGDEPAPDDDADDSAATAEDVPVTPVGLGSLCADVRHQPPLGQEARSASGIWLRGEVYGLEGGWIWVEGESLNLGEPVQIPIEGGTFEAPLGINDYGDHPLDRFELGGPDIDPIDLLPTLDDGPGSVFEVDADEGAAFGEECYVFEPGAATQDPPADNPGRLTTDEFLDVWQGTFVESHTTGDTQALLDTLHPAVFEAYGEEPCAQYVTDTTGSIAALTIVSSGGFTDFEFETPDGSVVLPDAIPFSAEITTSDGDAITNDGHIVIVDNSPTWLTRCGAE